MHLTLQLWSVQGFKYRIKDPFNAGTGGWEGEAWQATTSSSSETSLQHFDVHNDHRPQLSLPETLGAEGELKRFSGLQIPSRPFSVCIC